MQTNINIVTDAKRIILYRYITIEVHHPNACLNSSRRSSTNSSNRRLSRRTSASSSSLGTSLIEWSSSSRRDARLATDEAYASMNSVTNCLARGGASSRLPDARNPASGRISLPLSRSLPIRGPASSLPSLPAAVGPWRLVTDVGSPPSGFTTPSPRSRASSCVGTDTPASSSGPCVAIPGEHVLRHASFKKKLHVTATRDGRIKGSADQTTGTSRYDRHKLATIVPVRLRLGGGVGHRGHGRDATRAGPSGSSQAPGLPGANLCPNLIHSRSTHSPRRPPPARPPRVSPPRHNPPTPRRSNTR